MRIFHETATRFPEENKHLTTVQTYAFHLKALIPEIGDLQLYQVHMGTLQANTNRRQKGAIRTRPLKLFWQRRAGCLT